MELIADRFVMLRDDRAIDLATGERVSMHLQPAAGVTEQTRWMARCDALHKLRHRALAQLVDYGAVGESKRFEAWRCVERWQGDLDEAGRALSAALWFLRACGLSAHGKDAVVCRVGQRPVLKPAAGDGYECAGSPECCPLDFESHGFGHAHVERRAVAALSELFNVCVNRPRVVGVCGPRGSGKTSLVLELARTARLRGYVPVAVQMASWPALRLAAARSLFLIDDEIGTGWRCLTDFTLRAPKPHVLLMASVEEASNIDVVVLERLSPTTLIEAVRPCAVARHRRVQRAAKWAKGSPGRFVETIDGSRHQLNRGHHLQSRVAEQAPSYQADVLVVDDYLSGSAVAAWTPSDDTAGLRQRMDAAIDLLEQGRHAPGVRVLRQAIGGVARRGDWSSAARGQLALAGSLLKRGHLTQARSALDGAREHAARASPDAPATSVATMLGHVCIDELRLDEGETVLRTAVTVAAGTSDTPAALGAALGLARCLFWQGRYVEAEEVLEPFVGRRVADRDLVRLGVMSARAAVGRHDFARAVSLAAEGIQVAASVAMPSLVAEASCTAAFVHLALGDVEAVHRHAAVALAAARAARDPLRAFRVRLVVAESARRSTRRSEAADALRTLKRISLRGLPAILRERLAFLNDLVLRESPSDEVLERRSRATGLHALKLFLPLSNSSSQHTVAFDAELDDVVQILRLCQTADEETAVLKALCGQVHRRLRCASVGVFGLQSGQHVVLAHEGARIDHRIAERTLTTGLAIPPHRLEERHEAAAPITHGGATIGAIAVRWPLGSPPASSRATSVLAMAAAAAAPFLSALLAGRARVSASSSDLIGSSQAMIDLRRAVDRAADAPFAVLIEGESGSGKELVARALHRRGARRDRRFCTLNCAALPDDLVESELFGHARGAFTGAVADRPGVFEEAHGGVLFLDEVGELSARAQAKLLRVIQEGELRRIGENVSRRIDVRIVAATNRALREEVDAGRFRLDLFYRLDVVRIVVPPLRDRREDIPLLTEYFWRDAAARLNSRATLGAATLAALARYDWPGNVRELQNVLASLVVRSGKRGSVPATALPPQFGAGAVPDACRLEHARRTFDERFVRAALVRTGGRRREAATELGLSRQGLAKLMSRLGIDT